MVAGVGPPGRYARAQEIAVNDPRRIYQQLLSVMAIVVEDLRWLSYQREERPFPSQASCYPLPHQ